MKRFLLSAALVVLAISPSLVAQQPNGQGGNRATPAATPAARPARPASVIIWKAELPGGTYEIARGAILAISSQQYVLDGAARVTEVNITTAGPFQPRFYCLEPLTPVAADAIPGAQAVVEQVQAQAQSASDRVAPGDPPWAKVVKNYPTTTHAGTIEFRLETRDQLDKLFESVERAWTTGKSETYTPAGAVSYREKKKSEAAAADGQDAASPDATDPAAN